VGDVASSPARVERLTRKLTERHHKLHFRCEAGPTGHGCTLLALWLEHRFAKDQILEIYLNRVYLGARTYGVDAAAHRYFGKSAQRTTPWESAAIAGILKAPSRFNPLRDRDKTAARTAQVLASMVEAGGRDRRDPCARGAQGGRQPGGTCGDVA
jgi:penicillin-binding protein 1A